jgi:thymidylate synthase (FAD)
LNGHLNDTGFLFFIKNLSTYYLLTNQLMHTVQLIHITPEAENLISYMARVSNPSNQSNTETSAKLIKYLIDHQHWSPFEMVNMCVEINTTRSIAAQILRHRSFSFQEFSQRYADVTTIGTPIIPALRRQDFKNRQNSIDDLDTSKKQQFLRRIQQHFAEAEDLYREMVSAGVAKECARDVLPLSAPSRIYMNGTIRSWLHYCDLRTANGTQREHAQIAGQVQDILYQHLPNVCEAMWNRNLS